MAKYQLIYGTWIPPPPQINWLFYQSYISLISVLTTGDLCVRDCTNKENGNYQNCRRCGGIYVACTDGELEEDFCDGDDEWHEADKMCKSGSSDTCDLKIVSPSELNANDGNDGKHVKQNHKKTFSHVQKTFMQIQNTFMQVRLEKFMLVGLLLDTFISVQKIIMQVFLKTFMQVQKMVMHVRLKIFYARSANIFHSSFIPFYFIAILSPSISFSLYSFFSLIFFFVLLPFLYSFFFSLHPSFLFFLDSSFISSYLPLSVSVPSFLPPSLCLCTSIISFLSVNALPSSFFYFVLPLIPPFI